MYQNLEVNTILDYFVWNMYWKVWMYIENFISQSLKEKREHEYSYEWLFWRYICIPVHSAALNLAEESNFQLPKMSS